MITLTRPYETNSGRIRLIPLEICKCGNRRGPLGGVCWKCGDAIPSPAEEERINRKEDSDDE